MAYKNKTYVAFDGDNDIHYYRLMKAWKQNDSTNFNFYDAHDLKNARDTSTEESIKKSLLERMNNSKVFILLIGEHTKNLYKFVRWEIDEAIRLNLPIICVNLNGSRVKDDLCPPILGDKLAIFIPFKTSILQLALDSWPQNHYQYKNEGKAGAYQYNDDIYTRLNL